MPRGLTKIESIAKEAKARSDAYESGEGGSARALYLTNDAPDARGRFLEEGDNVWSVWTHPLPKKQNQRYADKTLCLDQPLDDNEVDTYRDGSRYCAGCSAKDVSRNARVIINFIRHDEPKIKRDGEGKAIKVNDNWVFDGTEPQLVVADFASGVGGILAFLERQFGPLSQHLCAIHKTGDKNNPYTIAVVEKDAPVSDLEKQLYEKKISPPVAIRSMFPRFKSISLLTEAQMKNVYSDVGTASGFQNTGGGNAPADNIYNRQDVGGHVIPAAFN